MKLFIFLGILACQALAENDYNYLKLHCIQPSEPVRCLATENKIQICASEYGKKHCVKLCDKCPIQPKLTTTVVTKVACPKNIPEDGVNQVACWEANWNNEHGRDIIYLYKLHEAAGIEVQDSYYGMIQSELTAQIFAIGDVIHGQGPVTFSITSACSSDRRIEVNQDSVRVPVFPDMYQSKQWSWGTNPLYHRHVEDEAEDAVVAIEARAPLPRGGFKITVQPVYDQNFKRANPTSTASLAKGIVDMAKTAFIDPTLLIKFEIDVKDPLEYAGNVAANLNSLVMTTFPTADNKMTPFNFMATDVNVFLFITQTPIASITADFSIEFAIPEGVCSTNGNFQKAAVIENFGTQMIAQETAIRAIGAVLGFRPDYTPNPNNPAVPLPRIANNGQNCTNVGGYMDIPPGKRQWTACSNEDIRQAVINNKLTCLKTIDCPMTDNSDLCPAMARNIRDACNIAWFRTACPLSCSPLCRSSVIANATLPTSGCMSISCNETLATTTVSPAGSTAGSAAGNSSTSTCQPCTTRPGNSTTGGDCLLACSEMRRLLKCSYADVAECCKTSCLVPTKNPEHGNGRTRMPDVTGSVLIDLYESSLCESEKAFCCNPSFRMSCAKTCAGASC